MARNFDTAKKFYTDPRNVPGSLQSKKLFDKEFNKRFPTKRNDNILHSVESYTRFKQPRWKFARRKIKARGLNELWQADLAQTTDLAKAKQYGNPSFVLVVIDSVSRYTWLRGMKSKTSEETAACLADILRVDKKHPRVLLTDRGTEFLGAPFARLLTENGIVHFKTGPGSPHKAAAAERRIRHFKTILYKYLSVEERKSFTNVLVDIQNLINNSPSRTLPRGWTPSMVQTDKEKARYVMQKENEREEKKNEFKRFSFSLNEPVRVQERVQENALARKAYKGLYSKELFRIEARYATIPHTYDVVDTNGYKLPERVYSPELVRVILP